VRAGATKTVKAINQAKVMVAMLAQVRAEVVRTVRAMRLTKVIIQRLQGRTEQSERGNGNEDE
jgi:hypothetical protein